MKNVLKNSLEMRFQVNDPFLLEIKLVFLRVDLSWLRADQ